MRKYWNYISNLGNHPQLSADQKRNNSLVNRICLIVMLIISINIPLTYFAGDKNVTPLVIAAFFLMLPTFLFNQLKLYFIAKNYFYLATIVIITGLSLLAGKTAAGEVFYIASGIIPLLLYKNRKLALLLFSINVLLFFSVREYLEIYPPILNISEIILNRFFYFNNIATFLVIFLILHNLKKTNDDFEGELIEKSNLIQEKNREITSSIEYAKRLQDGMLISEDKINTYFPEAFVFFQPKDIISGDFYWIEKSADKILFAAVDCTGHGVPGAMVSLVGFNGLNRCVRLLYLMQPDKILNELAKVVEESFGESNEEVRDGMDIALCNLDYRAKKLLYAGANNPLYLVRKGALMEIKADRQAVGKVECRKPYTQHSIDLQKGDCIYIFSDGFADQFGGEKNKKYTYKRFRELLLNIHELPMEKQKEILKREFKNWQKEYEQTDDVCVFGVKFN